jgi:hypothetical protein
MPAPRFSTSESFNEKARWIRNFSANKCDVLIIGSSMSLNNIDASYIKVLTHGKSVLNAGSWGLTISESALLLKYLAPLCKPTVIVLATYYGDFNGTGGKKINWELFQNYINGESTIITYLKSMDPMYYLSTYIHRRSFVKKGKSIYQSLIFDYTGSVMFDFNHFEIDPGRWDAQNTYLPLDQDRVKENLSGLSNIENIVREHHSRLLVIATPLRQKAEEKLSTPEIARLWETVSNSVNNDDGVFIKVRAFYDFNDEQFTDFAHLNECGARKVTEVIAPAVIRLLQNMQ